jgi:hypothetical protein
MEEVLAFDVNETLLDLAALDDAFAATLGAAAWRPVWFQTMLQVAFTAPLTGAYVDFPTAQRARVSIEHVRLVAAHAWDVSGALAAGARAAFIARGGSVPTPLDPRPDLVVPDLAALADALT